MNRTHATVAAQIRSFLAEPPRVAEILAWLFIIAAVAGIRFYLVRLVPVALWSDDAGSYAASAFKWIHTGLWATDPRRGPIYSLFIAACAKLTGGVDAVMLAQHVLGGAAVLLAVIALRVMTSRAALLPFTFCSYAYAVYGLPIYLEQLVRNETLLFFFGTVAFVTWLLAIKNERPHWLWLSGLAAGLLMLTKNVYGPFPLVVVAGHLFYWRKTPRLAAKFALIFSVAFILPIAGARLLKQMTDHHRPPEPQAGILLYGRTAQFTDLEGGIEPEIKSQIRQEILDYRKLPKLDNNLILKRTVVPHLHRILGAQGKLPADVNRLCLRLAVEGIQQHKMDYVRQVLHDLGQAHFKGGYKLDSPKPADLTSTAAKLAIYPQPDPLLRVEATTAELKAHPEKKRFSLFHHWIRTSWLFLFAPVLFTTLLLPLFVFCTRSKMQLWWVGAAAVWFFTMVLLCTVGRPLDRYLLPVVPIIFWTLSNAVIVAVDWLLARFGGSPVEKSVNPAPSV